MKVLEAYQKAFASLPAKIREAEVEAETLAETTVVFQNGERQGNAASDVTELFVRASGEKTGFTYTQNLEEDPLEVLKRAYESSAYSQAEKPERMNGSAEGGTFTEPACESLPSAVLEEKAAEIDRWLAAQEPGLEIRMITVTDRVRTLGIVNTKGLLAQTSGRVLSVVLDAVEGSEMFQQECTFRSVEEIPASLFEKGLKKWRSMQLPEVPFASGTYPCVIDGSVMANILLTSWRMFSGVNYLAGSTPFAGKLGQRVGNETLRISDKAEQKGSGYRFALDCEGTAGADQPLVKDGILTGLMHDLATAEKMDTASTGNAGRKAMISGNIHTDVQVIPRNFAIEPGTVSLEELLSHMGNGIYLYESFDQFHSINTASGDYSIPCSGILIENGKMAGRIRGLTINGRVQELLAGIEEAADDLFVLPMLMLNSYTVASPSVRVTALNVSQ
ncbi:MAG: metallopeptidase TldD-related protein [Eubacteriales bacterium]|nr:metallopeptidase TldD-related protein [Eubacteriales bacterium]